MNINIDTDKVKDLLIETAVKELVRREGVKSEIKKTALILLEETLVDTIYNMRGHREWEEEKRKPIKDEIRKEIREFKGLIKEECGATNVELFEECLEKESEADENNR